VTAGDRGSRGAAPRAAGSETFFVNTDGGTYTPQNLGSTFHNLTRFGMSRVQIPASRPVNHSK
jgi:hypothetical protein